MKYGVKLKKKKFSIFQLLLKYSSYKVTSRISFLSLQESRALFTFPDLAHKNITLEILVLFFLLDLLRKFKYDTNKIM